MKCLCMWGCGREGIFPSTSYYGLKDGKMKCSTSWTKCPAKQKTIKDAGNKISNTYKNKSHEAKENIKQKRLSTLSIIDENGESGFSKNAQAVVRARRKADGTFSGSEKTKLTKRQCIDEHGRDIYQLAAIKTATTRFGQYAGLAGKTDFEKYRYWVYKITELQNLSLLENFSKRAGYGKTDDPYQLDHKFSVVQGFLHNIPPFIIGHISNLEMLPAKQNNSKGSNCSVTLEELFTSFDSYRQIRQ